MKYHADEDYTVLEFEKDGVGGVLMGKLKWKKQDKEFKPGTYYAVVFFPKIDGIGPAQTYLHCLRTLSRSPEAAIVKFMDGIAKGETWETYAKAGHKVRKVQISDLGPARLSRKKARP